MTKALMVGCMFTSINYVPMRNTAVFTTFTKAW